MGFFEIEEDDPLEDDGHRELHEHPPKIVVREEWGAAEPLGKEEFEQYPLPYIVSMHTKTKVCRSKEECCKLVREIQKKHMDEGEPDILFNFLLDMEGNIYVGRGSNRVSMTFPEDHKRLKKANKKSITIGLLGSGGFEPPTAMVEGVGSLIVLLFDGKFIDETTKFLWHELPIEGVPPDEEDKDDDEERLRAHVEEVNRSMLVDKEQERIWESAHMGYY